MRSALVGSGLLVVVGCGGRPGMGPMTIDELPARYQAAVCGAATTCGTFPDQAACEQAFPLAALMQPIVAAVKRGTIVFDGTLADQCVSELGAGCINREPPACEQMFQGQLPAGATCDGQGECAGGGVCGTPTGCTDACCAGTCGPPKVALGGDCSQDANLCQRGSHCESGTCVVDPSVGASCVYSRCAEPAVCSYPANSPQSATCLMPAATGAPCDPTRSPVCARSDDYCDATTMTCTRRQPPGAVCAATNVCIGYASCDSGVCVERGRVGAACQTGGVPCLSGLACKDGVCTVLLVPTACGG